MSALNTLAGVHSASVDCDGNGLETGDRVYLTLYTTQQHTKREVAKVTSVLLCRCSDGKHKMMDGSCEVQLEETGETVYARSAYVRAIFPPSSDPTQGTFGVRLTVKTVDDSADQQQASREARVGELLAHTGEDPRALADALVTLADLSVGSMRALEVRRVLDDDLPLDHDDRPCLTCARFGAESERLHTEVRRLIDNATTALDVLAGMTDAHGTVVTLLNRVEGGYHYDHPYMRVARREVWEHIDQARTALDAMAEYDKANPTEGSTDSAT